MSPPSGPLPIHQSYQVHFAGAVMARPSPSYHPPRPCRPLTVRFLQRLTCLGVCSFPFFQEHLLPTRGGGRGRSDSSRRASGAVGTVFSHEPAPTCGSHPRESQSWPSHTDPTCPLSQQDKGRRAASIPHPPAAEATASSHHPAPSPGLTVAWLLPSRGRAAADRYFPQQASAW